MEKKIEDYRHLYIGCEGTLTRKKTYGSPKRITEILHVDTLSSLEKLPSMYSFKPHLRKLDSMTEEERCELWNSIFWYTFPISGRHSRIEKKTTSSDPRWLLTSGIERLGIEDNGTVWADCDLSHYKHNQHEVTRWFLSKRFDLFDLIPAGLAIDAATLKP